MQKNLALQCASAVFLAVVSSSSIAATATLTTLVNASNNPNGVGARLCGTIAACDLDLLSDAPLLASDPDGVSISSISDYAYFSGSNTSGIANFVLTGSAHAKALPGSLHASAEVQANGTGGGDPPGDGVGALGFVQVTDQIRARSSTLPTGTPVTLSVLLDITGQGRGRMGITVHGKKGGQSFTGLFGGESLSSRQADSLKVISGQFTAEVGGRLTIEYYLQASAAVSTQGWALADVRNGRAASSNYGNSAFLYFSAADPANVTIEGLSGYHYVQPNPVPLPAAVWLLLPGIVVLARRRRALAG